MKTFFGATLIVLTLSLSGCGYNDLQKGDEQIKARWSEVLNQYQRRADLVPNLVRTVQAYAEHERTLFNEVTNARAKVGAIQISDEMINNSEQVAGYQAAQTELSRSLSRLLVVAENYPQLKSDGAFRDLQAQLEGTENRIAVARGRYIQAVQQYNSTVRSFPSNLTAKFFDHEAKPNFTVDNEAALSKPPQVNLSAK
jgi:LemA protein